MKNNNQKTFISDLIAHFVFIFVANSACIPFGHFMAKTQICFAFFCAINNQNRGKKNCHGNK